MDITDRKDVARSLLASGLDAFDLSPQTEFEEVEIPRRPTLLADLSLPFPTGLAPTPQPFSKRPDAEAALPQADVLVVTWTVAENDGLADVMTPGFNRQSWYRYRRNFDDHYDALIREGAPSKTNRRLGSWFLTKVGNLRVICFKSELHLNQDGINLTKPGGEPAPSKTGFATLPVKDLLAQLIDEVKPKLVITTGTAGASYREHCLGDVVVTRGAKFRLSDEFKNEEFNAMHKPGTQYKSEWTVPTEHIAKAEDMMKLFQKNIQEPDFAPPTMRYDEASLPGNTIKMWPNVPHIIVDGVDGHGAIPAFHPILTTDFFEFGTSGNGLEQQGCAVEMGDAVLGMVCEEMENPPKWLVVRNLSDPQINANLQDSPRKLNMQAHFAVWYYEVFGYWTSVNGALACWAVIAGLKP
jgi:nucleoside phosphorylase